jgi:hypothetical protein
VRVCVCVFVCVCVYACVCVCVCEFDKCINPALTLTHTHILIYRHILIHIRTSECVCIA